MAWYAVQTKSKQECIAQEHLERQGYTTFLPTIKTSAKRSGSRKVNIEPLFPGYLFVELEIGVQNISSIRSTRGVVRLVKNGDIVLYVPLEIIAGLKKVQFNADENIENVEIFSFGDEVILTDGPLAGFKAVYKTRSSEERVILLMAILGESTQVGVSPSILAKVS